MSPRMPTMALPESTFSQGERHLNFTRRQPFGVVAKIKSRA
jgi:hypothetical protein